LSSDTDLSADSIDGKFHIDYVATTHTFTITAIPATETDPGVATKADFESLLQGVQYNNRSDDPTAGNRTVTVTVTDAGADEAGGSPEQTSVAAEATITVQPTNDTPSIDGLDGVSEHATATDKYLQGGDPVVIDGNVSLADPELGARNDWSGATLTISRQGGASSDDLFGVDGSSVQFSGGSSGDLIVDGTTIGTYSNENGTLQFTFNSAATTALVNEAARSITYSNAVTQPGALVNDQSDYTVTLDWVLNDQNSNTDGGGGTAGAGQDQGRGGELQTTQSIELYINRRPVARNDSYTVDQDAGTMLLGDARDNDSDQDNDDLHTVEDPIRGDHGGLFDIDTDGKVTFDPNGDFADLHAGQTRDTSFTYTLSDGHGGFDTATVTVTVTGTNDAPTAIGKLDHVEQNDSTVVDIPTQLKFADVDNGNVFTYTATGLPPGLSIDKSTGEITGTLAHDASQGGDHGLYTVVVTATDDGGLPVSQTFTFQVLNPPPEAHPDTGAVDADSTLSVGGAQGTIHGAPGRDTDVDGDPLTVIGVRTGAAGDVPSVGTANVGTALVGQYGTLTLNADGSYTYVADQPGAKALKAHTTAVDVFSYAISDGNGGVSYSTLSVSVTGIVRALPQPPAPPDYTPIIEASERPSSHSDKLITDPPHIWEDAYHENRVTNLSMPMHPIVYVEVTVQAEQDRRDSDDASADGVDLDLVLPIEAELSSWTPGLGQDQTIYVRHAVERAERERLILQGRALGRDGRTSLSADNLLPNHGIFASNKALQWLARSGHDRDAQHGADSHGHQAQGHAQGHAQGQDPGQDPGQGRGDAGRTRGASAFSEQLRRMGRNVSADSDTGHSGQPAHPFVRVAKSNPSIITE
ncbi:VCBS domain-containing protein, partial [Candidimonas humi]|uniref:Ig-like domain-containing protein n=1 Tax=Candidimonas humi TaxID=683355 RepID=UPI001C3EFDAF